MTSLRRAALPLSNARVSEMRSLLRKCGSCGRYTLDNDCPICGSATVSPMPIRFSPDDRYGEYRRIGLIQEYGENGKYRDI